MIVEGMRTVDPGGNCMVSSSSDNMRWPPVWELNSPSTMMQQMPKDRLVELWWALHIVTGPRLYAVAGITEV